MNDYLGYIAVWPGGENQFVAQAIGFPDVKAEGATESEAVEKVRNSLTEFLSNAKLVKYSLPAENPWLKAFGSAADDPDFDIYLEEIQKARMAADEE
jgi:hypothetical protein